MALAKPTPRIVQLIVTGDMERASLVPSLRKHFPETVAGLDPVEWRRPQKVHEATSSRCRPDHLSRGFVALANALVAEVADASRADEPADLVLAVGDVELHNLDQIPLLVDRVRAAVNHVVEARQLSQDAEARLREALRTRGGFHLLCPMSEAYFFGGDDEPLRTLQVDPAVRGHLRDPDAERFDVIEETWAKACAAEDTRRQSLTRPEPWWREACHPKHYLQHLAPTYDEMLHGAPAFERLSWPRVPSSDLALAFARSLFEDLAAFFAVPNPLGAGATSPLTCPPKATRRSTLLLRNL